ncbi:uncharacterized protein L3040_008157 [Drepanopeziza brunnea f. sp. 'multigermtubi']|uniref:uncharacterized protein n=1 Tax=Drepanopeziza brunnea f. sp. 'multigermtubi' TaxID=698441 RepID=UPI002386E322|nr:hypothetical protein L3040_008157 [Drepanopeziza brunnea f. sp. 'multigermtubi']
MDLPGNKRATSNTLKPRFKNYGPTLYNPTKGYDEALQRTRPQFINLINRYAIRQSYKKSQNHLSSPKTPLSRATAEFSTSQDRVATKIVLRSSSDQTTLEATRATRQKKTRQNLRAFRTKSTLTKDSVQISVPSLSNPKGGSSTLGRTGKLPTSLKRPRINKRETKGIRIAKGKPKDTDITKLEPQPVTRMALEILTIADEKGTGEISKEIEATGTERVGTAPLGHQKDSATDPQRTPDPEMSLLRTLEGHGTPAYGIPSALDDDGDDFPELGATDPHLRAKELALFARSFPKELKYSRPDDDFRTQLKIFADQANRYGLTSDDYLAAFLIMLTKEAITFYYNHVIKAKLLTFKANAIAVKDHFETDHRRQAKYDR